ncbi:MAG: homoserine kinase [Rhizobacter sp.]|nr:homoserine kinase [Rhizobacter sp.]
MAVYTEVSREAAQTLLARLNLGALQAFEPCAGGIENTNYFCDADAGRFVLTLFERLRHDELPYYLHLMRHLADRGLPVPAPQADATGAILHTVCAKPAAVVERLPGSARLAPDIAHCEAVGAMLARMHLAALDYPRAQPNPRGLDWWAQTAPVIQPFLTGAQRELLDGELAFQQQVAASDVAQHLPRGAIHGDLFRDNVMFDATPQGDALSGFFDFYFAGTEALAFDIAVCLNDWCTDPASGRLEEARAAAFVRAYAAIRPLEGAEARLMPAMLRGAALRFWISRLWDLHLPRDAQLLTAHDPTPFEHVLRERVRTPWHPTDIATPHDA